jgi:ABC-2 type transport system ATP-binding protein
VTAGIASGTVRYGNRAALDGVTFDVVPSAVTVLIGGDGAGKSTALRVLVGRVPLDAGSVSRPAKQFIGYVPARGGLYPDLTVWENLAFSGTAYGLTGPALAQRSHQVLHRIGLGDVDDRLGGHLSGGMQRKLAVGLAILHRPQLLVLDEPTTGVDPVSRAQLWRLISAEAASGAAVVVSTTYVNEAQRAQVVVLLDRGRVIRHGAPEDVIAAIPGKVGLVRSDRQPSDRAWLRGRAWRVWAPDGCLPTDAEVLQPNFDDAVIVAELGHAIGGDR